MKAPLIVAAIVEIATGLGLLFVPAVAGRLLLGAELSGVTIVVARVASVALIALGIACWPNERQSRPALNAMLFYNLLVLGYLVFLGLRGEWVGPLLWPAVGLHAFITIFVGRAFLAAPRTGALDLRSIVAGQK